MALTARRKSIHGSLTSLEDIFSVDRIAAIRVIVAPVMFDASYA